MEELFCETEELERINTVKGRHDSKTKSESILKRLDCTK